VGIEADIVAQPDSQLLHRARKAGIPCAEIPIRFDAAPWTLFKLMHHFRRSGTTAIWANMTKDLKAGSVAGRLARVPVIFGSRESDFPLKSKFYYKWYFNRMASGLFVNSKATERTVLDSAPWLYPDRVHLVYKGIDTVRFGPREYPQGPAVVGFVGQLIERKGLRDLMRAWETVDRTDRHHGSVLRLAGEGPLQSEIQAWRHGLNRPDNVELMGFIEEVESFYPALSMLAMPSMAEGFGLAAAEASACGIPVIATNTSSLPEIVRHDETGLLVPPGEPDILATAILQLLDDPDLGRQLGRAGRTRIVDRFTQTRTLRRLLELTGGPVSLFPEGSSA
jgi:glycosyltransferase involved in cell wall biosynthesis